jgi:hypothetical protein
MPPILLAHANNDGEAERARPIAEALRKAGYEVVSGDTILVGDSLHEKASIALEAGSPVVLCGTAVTMGSFWPHRLIHAAHGYPGIRVFALKMDKEAWIPPFVQDDAIADYWENPAKALADLGAAIRRYYPRRRSPLGASSERLEAQYRDLALRTNRIIDLASLPVTDLTLSTDKIEVGSLYIPLRIASATVSDIFAGVSSTSFPQAQSNTDSEIFSPHQPWPVGKWLAKSPRLMLLGDPGSGKSTLLRWLATAYLLRVNDGPPWPGLPGFNNLPNEDWLPILIRCRDLEGRLATTSLEEMLGHHVRSLGVTSSDSEVLTELLLDRLAEGSALLLLDGIDEIIQPTARVRFCRQIEQIHVAYQNAPIIATSRIAGYREMGLRIGRGFEHGTVLELTAEDKDEFARRWCALTELEARRDFAEKQLIKDIHSTDRIKRITGNPMLLTTMALVRRRVGKLPGKRADLYREAVDVLLDWRRDVDEPLPREEAIPQLEYLAYAMCMKRTQRLRVDQIIALLTSMRSDFPGVRSVQRHEPAEFLRLVEAQTGILVEIGRVRHKGRLVPAYEFRHSTFQEYLAGLALIDERFPVNDRLGSLAENISPLAAPAEQGTSDNNDASISENWQEVLRLCVMSCNDDDVDDALLSIASVRADENAAVATRPRTLLAVSCLADEPSVSENLAVCLIDRLTNMLKEHADVGHASAQRVLQEVGPSRWGPVLSHRLLRAWLATPDSDLALGAYALDAIRPMVPEDTERRGAWIAEAARRLQNSESDERIYAALSVLAVALTYQADDSLAESPPWPITNLLSMLGEGGREAEAAAWALGVLAAGNMPDEIPRLWKASENQKSAIISRIKSGSLSYDAIRFLLRTFDGNHSTCKELAHAVASYIPRHSGDVANYYGILFPEYAEPLIELLGHGFPWVRQEVLRQLRESRDPAVNNALLAVALRAITQLSTDAALTLAERSDQRAVAPLIGALDSLRGDELERAAEVLGRLGDPRAITPLSAIRRALGLTAPSPVVGALATLGDGAALQELHHLMHELDEGVRRAGLWAMGRTEHDAEDRALLSRSANGEAPGIDPNSEISQDVIELYATARKLGTQEVRRRYEQLQERYPLRLAWKAAPTPTPPS